MDFFRNFFLFPNRPRSNSEGFFGVHQEDDSSEHHETDLNEFTDPIEPNVRNFNVFTDPLEMHRYFEQQMDHILRSFGFPNFGNFFHHAPGIQGPLTEENVEEPKNLREQYLKRDYLKPNYEHSSEKMDKDLDGKLNLGDLDSAFKDPSNKQSLDIYREPKAFGGTFFNQTVRVKTIRKSDGSLESQRTVCDSQGNEETTITHKLGDKEYTIIKKRDKEGKEETQEIMVNMEEKDKDIFQKPVQPYAPKGPYGGHFDSSLFNRFFK